MIYQGLILFVFSMFLTVTVPFVPATVHAQDEATNEIEEDEDFLSEFEDDEGAVESEDEDFADDFDFDEGGEEVAEEDAAGEDEDFNIDDAEEEGQEETAATEDEGDGEILVESAEEETSEELFDYDANTNPAPEKTQVAETIPTGPITGSAVNVTDLRFLAEENSGTVMIETNAPADYTARRNPRDRQLVIEIANASLPRKFSRPFVTKDFPSNIGSVNAYQPVGSSRTFVVVQMKDDSFPTVQQTDNRILVAVLPKKAAKDSGALLMKKNLDDFLLSEQRFYGKKINIVVKDANVRDVLNLIAEQSGVNLILSKSVKGKTSIKLREIPWDQALILVLQANGLGYVRQGSVLRIATQADIRKEAETIRSITRAKENAVPLVLRIMQLNYAKSDNIEKQIKPFMSKRGKLSADKQTNSILVHDIPDIVDKIEKLVETLDYAPPQVLIEGKVVEAQSDLARDLGVNWSFGGSPVEIGTNTDGGQISVTPSLDVSPTAASVGLQGMNFNLNIGTLDLFGDLSARLGLFERNSQVKVVSSPKVITITNEEATVLQTTEVPLITSTADGGVVTKGVTFKPVKLQLKVTPLVTSDNSIILDVNLEREFAGGVVEAETQARPVNKRSAKTKVLVKNGQTAVLGGVFQSDATEAEQGVPYLRKIPIFGQLFESRSKTEEKNELMVFITPRILEENQTRL